MQRGIRLCGPCLPHVTQRQSINQAYCEGFQSVGPSTTQNFQNLCKCFQTTMWHSYCISILLSLKMACALGSRVQCWCSISVSFYLPFVQFLLVSIISLSKDTYNVNMFFCCTQMIILSYLMKTKMAREKYKKFKFAFNCFQI